MVEEIRGAQRGADGRAHRGFKTVAGLQPLLDEPDVALPDFVRHGAAETVEFTGAGPPAGGVHRGHNAMHAVGCQEPIVDA